QVPDCLARQRASGHQALTAGTPGSPGIRSFGGHRVIWQGSGHRQGHQALDRGSDRGHRVTRYGPAGTGSTGHQVIWLASGGTASSGKAVGTGSPGALDRLARQRASGHQASGHLARQRAPRHLARQWAPSHQVRQRALSQLARQRAPGQVPDHLDQQRASGQSTG
ncbi:unnamed protein product, partial [Staurois parvus]